MDFNSRSEDLLTTDLAIVGGGPAGLSAAINASAEGLTTVLLEASGRFGGQAGTSSRIENYAGFSQGISGPELTGRIVDQADGLGAFLVQSRQVTEVRHEQRSWRVVTATGHEYRTRAVLVTTGMRWRHLDIPGATVSPTLRYNATPEVLEGLSGRSVAVIGAANSAGQAAKHLADNGAQVTILIRKTLRARMSDYLVNRLVQHPRVTVREHTEVHAVRDGVDGGTLTLSTGDTLDVAAAFVYVGSAPAATSFLPEGVQRDADGFLLTAGPGSFALPGLPGLFAAGDIRSGSRKRVATATGEGATATAEIWTYVRERLAVEAKPAALELARD